MFVATGRLKDSIKINIFCFADSSNKILHQWVPDECDDDNELVNGYSLAIYHHQTYTLFCMHSCRTDKAFNIETKY